MKALRDGFGEGILIAARQQENVVALSADLTGSNRLDGFRDAYPERFIQVGVAEQNMISLAAGMAQVGKIPFTASFAVFSPGRTWDQIRVSVCYSEHNVKIYGGHAGITVGEDGATHQALEDIAIMRALPNMTVIVPADAIEMRKATIAATTYPGPVYLRGGRAKMDLVTTEEDAFVIGKAHVLRRGKDVTIVACGIMVEQALHAAKELAKKKISAEVISCHTIKPLDAQTIVRSIKKTKRVVAAEEHQIHGGLGSAVAELVTAKCPVPIEFVGVQDTFGESGPWKKLLERYGLMPKDIVAAVQRVRKRK